MLKWFGFGTSTIVRKKELFAFARNVTEAMQIAKREDPELVRERALAAERDLDWLDNALSIYTSVAVIASALAALLPAFAPYLHIELARDYSPGWHAAITFGVFIVLYRTVMRTARGKRDECHKDYEKYALARAFQLDAEEILNDALALQTHMVLSAPPPEKVVKIEAALQPRYWGRGDAARTSKRRRGGHPFPKGPSGPKGAA